VTLDDEFDFQKEYSKILDKR